MQFLPHCTTPVLSGGRRTRPTPRKRIYTPLVELLEDRTVPSTSPAPGARIITSSTALLGSGVGLITPSTIAVNGKTIKTGSAQDSFTDVATDAAGDVFYIDEISDPTGNSGPISTVFKIDHATNATSKLFSIPTGDLGQCSLAVQPNGSVVTASTALVGTPSTIAVNGKTIKTGSAQDSFTDVATDAAGDVFYIDEISDPTGNSGPISTAFEIDHAANGATKLFSIPTGDIGSSRIDLVPGIVVDSVKTLDSETLTVDYDINIPNLTQPFDIDIFRYTKPDFDAVVTQDLIADLTIQSSAAETEGHHEVQVTLQGGLPPDPPLPYVLAVADPYSKLPGVSTDSSAAHFRVYTIGAVVPGFDITSGFSSSTPDWAQQMATSLGPNGDGYDYVIPFSWDSAEAQPGLATAAAAALDQEIVTAATTSFPDLKPNDTIDLHLIGHSRGAVVISQAMQMLLASPPNQQLEHGFMKLTLLDPHPADNQFGLNASFSPGGSATLQPLYTTFQAATSDGPIVVPVGVNEVDDFYEQTPFSVLTGFESTINLQGLVLGSRKTKGLS
jgi:hypothetical protein